MGIGINFVCTCCGYDSGILMLNQGTRMPLERVIHKYIDTYTNEIDLRMHSSREQHYRSVLAQSLRDTREDMTYNYFGCVCYGCNKTYEMLDLLKKKEEVYAGDSSFRRRIENPIQHMFHLSNHDWSSLLGETQLCVFCNQEVERITEEKLEEGLDCPKCLNGHLKVGEEFEIWD